ncbi:hypothetical protein B0H10DRAFT_2385754 [Mycena sp. CBHHK59/15]|nr:hypothetical protein B0H10DRAFT_2385754 [Mycena sp. CBHHK59/15]
MPHQVVDHHPPPVRRQLPVNCHRSHFLCTHAVLPSADYGFSSSMDPTGLFAQPATPLPPDLFPFHLESAATASWDAGSASSWLPESAQQPSRPAASQWGDHSIPPHWDDLVSSFQPAAARTSSTASSAGGIFDDSYGFRPAAARTPSAGSSAGDLFDDSYGNEYSNSRFSSAPPSSILGDDDWASHPPIVSVEIEQWDGTAWGAADLPSIEPDVSLVDEAPDMDARLGWDFKPSNIKWLDSDVSSEVVEFPLGIKLTEKNKIYAFHRVTGCPSQFPFSRQRTGFLINLTGVTSMNPDREVTVDQLIRDQDSHSWGRSTGARNKPDAYLPGSFFGLSGDDRIACRRAAPECGGVMACESLDPAFLKAERRDLDPEDRRALAAATLRTREMQDDTEKWRCKGIRLDGMQCDGSICLRKLNTGSKPLRNKNHILLCSKRNDTLISGALHSQVQILDHVSEELFVMAMNGERIIDEDDTQGTCSQVVSGRTGSQGKAICPFNHHKNGLPYVAKVEPLTCTAKMHIYCPWETLHPELARMAIVVPFPESGHSHPPPPKNKCTHAIADRYRECVRKFGPGATVNKVENAQSTKDLLGGKTPSLFHPGLISRDTKTRFIQELKAEWNDLSSTAANTRQQVATYIADQEALSDEKRYLQSSLSREGKRIIFGAHPKLLCSIHDLRTLDCDTTFKPVAGEMQIFEVNGWLAAINEAVTVMRVWMEVHDRAAYKTVWEEMQRLVLKLTKKQLKFKGLHKSGKTLGLNSDMEAAPLLGFADAFVATVDLEHVRAVVLADPLELLSFVLRICYSHINRGIPKLLEHSSATRQRIFDLKYLKTREEVESFKEWIVTLADPQGVLKRWWDHKLMHRWLLPGIIQCLSNIPLEQWNTMEATTNLGEAQHAWNNAQTGISMGAIESFKKYEELDIRRAEEIEIHKLTSVPRTSRNEVTHRYASRTTRQSRMSEKGRRAHAIDSTVAGLQTELSEMQRDLAVARDDAKGDPSTATTEYVPELEDTLAELERKLKLAKAEAKSNSSGRVRPPKAAAGSTLPKVPAQAVLDVTPASIASVSEAPASVADGTSDLARRASTRKRVQAESSAAASSVPSRKRRRKLEDPLAGWVMEDPDTGEKLTGHEWVERFPDEFETRYKKDHQRYLDYLAQSPHQESAVIALPSPNSACDELASQADALAHEVTSIHIRRCDEVCEGSI